MSVQITVTINERGPADMRLRHRDRAGFELELDRIDPYLTSCEETAYRHLLDQGRRLPAGTIDVLVAEDEFRHLPAAERVGEAIAAAA